MATTMSRWQLLSLLALSALFLTVGALWAVLVPPFEKPDEIHHFAYVRFVATERRLPIQAKEDVVFIEEESQQPPIYYVAAAMVYSAGRRLGLTETDLGIWRWRANPLFAGKSTSPSAEPNFWIHQAVDGMPSAGPSHDLLGLRLFSLALGLAVVGLTYRIGLLTLANDHWLAFLAAGFVAFLPQFSFATSSTSNDALSWVVSALYLLLVLRLRDAPAGTIWHRYAILGLVTGIALLTKATLYCVIPLVFLVHPRATTRRQWLLALAVWAGVALLVGGWWFVRNSVLYGDALGRQEVINPEHYRWNLTPRTIFSPYFMGPFWRAVGRSYVGHFGFLSLPLSSWLYGVAGLIGAVSVAGFAAYGARLLRTRDEPAARERVRQLVVLIALPLFAFAGLILYNLSVTQPQGRLMFQALPAVAVLFAVGADEFRRWSGAVTGARRGMSIVVIAALLAVNLYALLRVVVPAYGEAARWVIVAPLITP